jgi:hypothetical protein
LTGTVQAATCGLPLPLALPVVGPPAGTITVLPAMAIGAFADVGSWRRKTIAPVLRLRAIRTPW